MAYTPTYNTDGSIYDPNKVANTSNADRMAFSDWSGSAVRNIETRLQTEGANLQPGQYIQPTADEFKILKALQPNAYTDDYVYGNYGGASPTPSAGSKSAFATRFGDVNTPGSAAYNEAQVAAGNLTKVPVGNSFSYVPTGSAADKNQANIGTQNTANEANAQAATQQAQQAQSTALSKVKTGSVGPDGKPIYDVFSGSEHIADPNDPRLKGVDINTLADSQAPAGFRSKFEQGFNQANSQGIQSPTSGGQGSALVGEFAPGGIDNPKIADFFAQDPFMAGLVKTFQDYINPANQKKSLADTYKQMVKDSGVEALDMELINTKKVIEGSEDDIRTEITKAGGFATESQVMALTNARNKQLIKNYNTLLETRNAKEKYLDTMIGFEQQDRQDADKKFETAFNMGLQIADYQQKMQQNAIASLDRAKQAIGWAGILQSTANDPYTQRLVEKTYGLPAGGLQIAAQRELEALAEQTATPAYRDAEGNIFDSAGNYITMAQIPKKPDGTSVFNLTNLPLLGSVIGGSGGKGGSSGISGNGSGGGTGKLSPEAQAVISGTLRLEDLTPTVRGKIAGELTAAGYTSGPKLSSGQQDELASMQTVQQLIGQIQDYNKDGKLEGVGFGTGPLGAAMTKMFGTGSEEAKTVRALISNVKGTIAKLRGGTSFTPNEQKLLDSYTPSVNESAASVINKLALLSDFIEKGRNNLMNFAQDRKVTSGSVDDLRAKYNY